MEPTVDSGMEPSVDRPVGRRSGLRRELVENEIHEQAARLFSERGFAGTSPQDIADAVGITRQALYYYVNSKEQILARLVQDVTDRDVEEMRAVQRRAGLASVDKLHAVARLLVIDRARHPRRFQLLDRSAAALPADLAQQYRSGRRAALAVLTTVITDGIADGSLRRVDARVAALSVLGMCNWVAWWFEPSPEHPVEPVADQIADGAVAMLTRPHVGPRANHGVDGAIAALRDDLALLEQAVDQHRRPPFLDGTDSNST